MEKRHSTIIIIPHAQGKVHKLRLSPTALKAFVVGAVGMVLLSIISLAASGSFLRQRAMYRSLERDNSQLRRSSQRLSETVKQVQARLNQFEQRTRSLAIAAGVSDLLGSAENLQSGVGAGGPLDRLAAESETLVSRQEALDQELAKVERRLGEQTLMLQHTPSIAPVVGVLTDGYGPRMDPFTHRPAYHEAVDLSVAVGTPVRASAGGIVTFAARERGLGRVIKVNHGYGYVTVYAHLDRFLVKEGDRVTRNQLVGKVGMTGRTTGPHLHYEVWKDGERKNPLHFILDAY